MKQIYKHFGITAAVIGIVAAPALYAATCTARSEFSRQLIVAVDESNSITPQQRAEWEPALQNLVWTLCPGDTLEVFGIHSQTLNAKPLFNGILPPAPLRGATLQQLISYKQSILTFREDATTALIKASRTNGASKATDLFSLLDRVRLDPARRLEVIIFSDALQANSELNLERVRLVKGEFGALIQKLADKHGWTSATLAGGSIQFVLPSLEDADKNPGPNNRLTLKAFYSALFDAMGARLTGFDTQLADGGAL